jgi:Carboxypeptidase regulatory-like domain
MIHRTRIARIGPVILLSCVLLAQTALAQQASGIAGVVRDTSGGVLPGVTVEAASPALIEKSRVAISNGEGRYNIVDLRPGTYTVTFTIAGFNAFRREGITLTAGFTATVNADMTVGSLEETIIVSGSAPLVDTQSVRQQKVISTALLATLPSGSMGLQNLVTLTPGVSGTPDVGGSSGRESHL